MFGLTDDQIVNLLYLVALLAFVIGGTALARGRRREALRDFAVWAGVALVLVTVYAYRAPLLRFAAPVLQELDPSRVVEVIDASGETELVIARGADGHFQLDALVNGVAVRFLVDTGASSTVLSLTDAKRSGIDTDSLQFNRPVQTANGVARYASARIESLEIGPYRLSGIPVGVMPEQALDFSLLGMSTIDRFASWRVEGNRMVLIP